MPLANLKAVLEKAYLQKYAVGAFNIVDHYFLDSILEAATVLAAPVILSVAEVHLPFIELEDLANTVRKQAAEKNVPIVLHLDHGFSLTTVLRALECGFSSVMFDGSHLPLEENIFLTKQVVEICHPKGVSVEGELGIVGGAEEGEGGQADPNLYTNVDDASSFVLKTGIDALAVAIGNVHGRYYGEPKLNFERLGAIRQAVCVPLVLHGGSGISAPDFQKAITLGISKINVYSAMASAAMTAMHTYLSRENTQYNDYPLMMTTVKEKIRGVVKEHIQIFGSQGKNQI